MIFGVQFRHSNLRVKTWQARRIWAVTFDTDIPSIVDWLRRIKPCRSEDSRCPPKRGLAYWCCVSSGLASQVALLAALTSHVGLQKRWIYYIYRTQNHGRLYLFHLHQLQQLQQLHQLHQHPKQQSKSQSTLQQALPNSSKLLLYQAFVLSFIASFLPYL